MPTITAKSLKVTVVLDPTSLLAVRAPDGQPRVVLNIRLPDRTVTADLNAKTARKALAALRDYGAEACSCIIQGKLVAGDQIAEAGLVVQQKGVAKQDAVRVVEPSAA